MPESEPGHWGETREEVMTAPNLLELFCQRTSGDFRATADEAATGAPAAAMAMTAVVGVSLLVAGKTTLAKAAFLLLGVEVLWAVWDLVVRSSSVSLQKQEEIRRGLFPPDAAPLVLARLRWWNHLVTPLRWARHSRIHDRRYKLEKRIQQTREQLAAASKGAAATHEPDAAFVAGYANGLANRAAREERRLAIRQIADEGQRLREELTLCRALLHKTREVTDKLEHIEKLPLALPEFSASELTPVITDALAILDERRRLVSEVDAVDPDDFLELVTL